MAKSELEKSLEQQNESLEQQNESLEKENQELERQLHRRDSQNHPLPRVVTIRMSHELHHQLKDHCKQIDISMNVFVQAAITAGLRSPDLLSAVIIEIQKFPDVAIAAAEQGKQNE